MLSLAACPIKRSLSLNATTDGVVLLPKSLGIITTELFSHVPTHEYVVPKSIPINGVSDIFFFFVFNVRKIGYIRYFF